jgi:AraC-like DNA-binding protein
MLFEFNLYSSLLLIFFVHILVYAIMLWARALRQESTADKLLGSFLFLAALYVVPWMTGFAGWYKFEKPVYRNILFYTPFVHGLFFGPLLYLYVKSITNFNYRLSKADIIHFLPGILYIIWCAVVVIVDKLIVHKYYLMNGETDPDFDSWYDWLQKINIIVYLFFSLKYYNKYRRFTVYELSFADMAAMNWLRNFLIAFGILTLLPIVESILDLFPFFHELNYRGSWYKFMIFALVVYYIAISGFNATQIPLRRLAFKPELLLQYLATRELPSTTQITEDANFEIVTANAQDIVRAENKLKDSLLQYIEKEKPYLDPEVTLTGLAKKLGTNASVLSKVINTGTNQNFNDFINGYRIREVEEKLKSGEQKRQTLLGIAYDCGFNSKATFNRAFKKAIGSSPKEYAENLHSIIL